MSYLRLGREGAFRRKVVDWAGLKPGESVLDVGCGTGTLAITAKKRAGPKEGEEKRLEFRGIVIWRTAKRKIVERWAYLEAPHPA